MKVRKLISELKTPFKQRLRKNLVIRYMIVANFLVLALVSLFLLDVDAIPVILPFKTTQFEKDSYFKNVDSKISQLRSLVEKSKYLFDGVAYSSGSFYDQDENILGTIEYDRFNKFQRQPYVANGYIGSRIPNLGQGFAYDEISPGGTIHDVTNGWPLFNRRHSGAFVAGFYNIQETVNQTNFPELYENGYESIQATIPQWTTLTLSTIWDSEEFILDPSLSTEVQGPVTNYVQNLSLSTGIVTTEFTWLGSIQVRYEVIAHKLDFNLGIVRLQINNMGNSSIDLKVEDRLDFATSQRSQLLKTSFDDEGIYIAFQPENINYVTGAIYSRLTTDGYVERKNSKIDVLQSTQLFIKPGELRRLFKNVGIATSDLDEIKFDNQRRVLEFAKDVASKYDDQEYAINLHKDCWKKNLNTSITFIDDDLLTMVSRASLYHLQANSRENAEGLTAAISVGGLSSDSYGGMVFWDTDLWMFNSLLPFFPSSALSVINYRKYTHNQAKNNVPNGFNGAVYPWTSGRFGNCTSTGPCLNYEYHINTAIAMAAWNAYLSGSVGEDYVRDVIFPIIHDAALFFVDFVVYDDSLNSYVTYNMTDPDEYANHINNGAYTNAGISALMKWCIALSKHLNIPIDYGFKEIADNMYLPTSDTNRNITLEYSNMNSSIEVKQADVIMITYPIGNELLDEDQAFRNLQFYANKQSTYGPAMTFPIFSIVSAALSSSGCASQSYLRKSVTPYLRGPFAQFSEQNNDNYNTNGGTHPAFPFITAYGGFLQASLQGITGLRFGYKMNEDRIIRYLYFDPLEVPSLGNEILFENIHYMNHSITIRIHDTKFFIKNNGNFGNYNDEDYINLEIASRNSMAGFYKLYDYEELSFPLFIPDQSFAGSLTECNLANFISLTKGNYGDLTWSINDGDNSTHWQAMKKDNMSKILVDLKMAREMKGGVLNWGNKPPKHWKLYALNSIHNFDSVDSLLNILSFEDVHGEISENKSQYIDFFDLLVDENVEISEPFDLGEATKLQMPTSFNLTTFELGDLMETRFLMIEYIGSHDFADLDKGSINASGAKLVEVTFF